MDSVSVHVANNRVRTVADQAKLSHRASRILRVARGVHPAIIKLLVDIQNHRVRARRITVVAHNRLLEDRHQFRQTRIHLLLIRRLDRNRLAVNRETVVVQQRERNIFTPLLKGVLVGVRLRRREPLLSNLALLGNEPRRRRVIRRIDLILTQHTQRHEHIGIGLTSKDVDRHTQITKIRQILHIWIRLRIPHDHLRVLLQRRHHRQHRCVLERQDLRIGIRIRQMHRIIAVDDRRRRRETNCRATLTDLKINPEINTVQHHWTNSRAATLLHGVTLTDQVVQSTMLRLRMPIRLDHQRRRTNISQADLFGLLDRESDAGVDVLVGHDVGRGQALLELQTGQSDVVDHLLDSVSVHVANNRVRTVADQAKLSHRASRILRVARGVHPAIIKLLVDIQNHRVRARRITVVAHNRLLEDRHQFRQTRIHLLLIRRLDRNRLAVNRETVVVQQRERNIFTPLLKGVLVGVRLRRREPLLSNLALLGNEPRRRRVIRRIDLILTQHTQRHEHIGIGLTSKDVDRHTQITKIRQILHIWIRLRIPHDHLRVLLQRRHHRQHRCVLERQDLRIGIRIRQMHRIIAVDDRRRRRETNCRATLTDLKINPEINTVQHHWTNSRAATLLHGVTLTDQVVQSTMLRLRMPIRLDHQRRRTNIS